MKITERERRDFEWLEDHCWVLPPEERGLGKRDEKPNTATAPPKLSEEDLREAIRLGVKMAEADALLMLTRKARQVRAAEIEERRPHLVINPTLH